MKAYLISIAILLNSCKGTPKEKLYIPTDSAIYQILNNRITEQNKLDGGEFVTADTLLIKDKKTFAEDSICLVRLYFHCTYQPAPLPTNYKRNSFEVIADSTIELVYKNDNWELR